MPLASAASRYCRLTPDVATGGNSAYLHRPGRKAREGMDIRNATAADVAEIQAIYAHHVLHGAGTFEEEPPSVEEMQERFDKVVGNGHVWLVATDGTGVLGYGYYTA